MKYLIVGRSGAGKDYLVEKLVDMGLTKVKSYTTRPKRSDNEDSHTFITEEEAAEYTDRVVETKIGEVTYFATREQVEESDLYTINPAVINTLARNMPDTEFQIVYVQATNDDARKTHAIERADDKEKEEEKFNTRNQDEDEQFTDFEHTINTRMDTEVCFPDNITAVIIFENDYTDSSAEKIANQLFMHRQQLQKMTNIVEECLDLNVLSTAKHTDSYGRKKVAIYWQKDEDDDDVSQTECPMERSAIRLLDDPENFLKIMGQYITLSPRFDKKTANNNQSDIVFKDADEILADRDENDRVEGYVSLHISDIIDNDYEAFLDILSTELVGSDLLMDIDYNIVSLAEDPNTLILKVTGDASEILESDYYR